MRIATISGIAAIGMSLVAVGCTTDASDSSDEGSTISQEVSSSVVVPNPSGAYYAKVTANGTGCPAGTWDASISEDGKAFTVTFSAYEATVEPGASFAVKDCTLALDLKTPPGFSFSVTDFHYQGYAILDKTGMTARQTAKYYFMGNPVPAVEKRSDMKGPYDNSYLFSDQVGVADLVWSPCGEQRRLNAQTRLVVRNNSSRTGSGYLNTASADGTIDTKLRFTFGLRWKSCS